MGRPKREPGKTRESQREKREPGRARERAREGQPAKTRESLGELGESRGGPERAWESQRELVIQDALDILDFRIPNTKIGCCIEIIVFL